MATLNQNKYQIKELIKEKALTLGFVDCRVADYKILDAEAENYSKWLGDGFNASMAWMEKNIDKRRDVQLILPDVRSVITLAFSYFTGNIHPKNIESEVGKISRYAWGSDYHEILQGKLAILCDELKLLAPEFSFRYYVDTGPVLEKQWAVQSGLGWQGKNSLILNKKFGSYFFIGVIFSSLEIASDSLQKDYCGSCVKCITECPTNAIIADKIVDSNRCISYWTIEAKAETPIPDIIAKNAKNWIFGCDICQEVCPWNRHKPVLSGEDAFTSRLSEGTLSKEQISYMTQEQFSEMFRKSPVKRLKLAGLKRNSRDILIDQIDNI